MKDATAEGRHVPEATSAVPPDGAGEVLVLGSDTRVNDLTVDNGSAGEPPPATPEDPAHARPPIVHRHRRRRRAQMSGLRLAWLLAGLPGLFLALWTGVHLLSGRPLELPAWATARIEARANAALALDGRLSLSGVVVTFQEMTWPRVALRGLALAAPDGTEIVQVPEVRARFSPEDLIQGRVALSRLTVSGAELALRRDREGRFGLEIGGGAAGAVAPGSLGDILALIDRALAENALAPLEFVAGEGLTITFDDDATGQRWRAGDGNLLLRNSGGRRSLVIDFSLEAGTRATPAQVQIAAASLEGEGWLSLGGTVQGMEARDLARQIPALAWLSSADAAISAALRGRFGPDGQVEAVDGILRVGEGRIEPEGGARPIPFNAASIAFGYEASDDRIEFTEIVAETPEAAFRAEGQALLRAVDPVSGLPGQLLVQLALSDVLLDPDGELTAPARFETGAADLRLRLAPFGVDIGQLVLADGARRFTASGAVTAGMGGWDVAIDAEVDRVDARALPALWPVRLVPRTRDWVTANVTAGEFTDLRAAIRLRPDGEERLGLGFSFEDLTMHPLRTMPPVVGARGHATLAANRFALVLHEGKVAAPGGGVVDLARSAMIVPDVRDIPSSAEVRLELEGTIPAALSLLSAPPVEILERSGRGLDLAEGRIAASAVLTLPLVRSLRPEDVTYSVEARLTEVRSETLVPGRTLEAEALRLAADVDRLTISGPGRLGGAVFDASWTQALRDNPEGTSRIEGALTIDQAMLDEFGINLPRGSVSGAGSGQITVDLARGASPRFRLVSDLNRLGLSIPALGWSKRPAATGRLEVAGTLGAPAAIDTLNLTAPGLEAAGRVTLRADGSLGEARFERVRAGRWLDASVTLAGAGAGRDLAVTVRGGTIDLRETSFGASGGQGGGPLRLEVDRVIVSQGLSFSPFRADLTTRGGLSGRFNGRLAGAAAVDGTLAPTREGTAVRMTSEDAGAVLRAAGLLDGARQGRLDLTLMPQPGDGRYEGQFSISNLRLRGAPALADLLGAISVVGLIEQLNGQGIAFGEVTGEFSLEPAGIILRRGSAVGPSLGVSMAGVYDLRRSTMDMRGTISPIYLLNGIGQIFSRRGEGLFGFNYRMSGPTSNPRTQVNPLSILTPGMFREIFRTAPPTLGQ